MLDFLKKPIFLIILAAALIAAGIWAYVSNRNKTKEAEQVAESRKQAAEEVVISNLTNIDTTYLDADIKNQLTVADTKAAENNRKNQLVAVVVQLPGSLATASGDSGYVYSASSDKVNNWLITISNTSGSFLRALVPKEDYLGDLSAINRDFWKINYLAALQIAEKNGGLDFRNANEISDLKLTLKNGDPNGWLYWFVIYTAKSDVKQFQIDANSGSLVVQENQ